MEIGARLKEAREAKGMSIEDVQKETKIQTRYLQAIEKGNFSIMPGKFYTRAFIRQYAEAVGLDPEVLMEEHKSELPSSSEEEYIQYTRLQRHKDESSSTKNSAFMSFLPKLTIILLIIAIVVIALVFYQRTMSNSPGDNSPAQQTNQPVDTYERSDDSSSENTNDEPDTTEESTDVEQKGNNEGGSEDSTEDQTDSDGAEEQPEEPKQTLELVEEGNPNTGSTPVSVYELKNAEEMKLTFSTVNGASSYVDIKDATGKIIFMENLVKDGQEVDLSEQKEVLINVGRAPAVTLQLNGEPLDFPLSTDQYDVQKIRVVKASSE